MQAHSPTTTLLNIPMPVFLIKYNKKRIPPKERGDSLLNIELLNQFLNNKIKLTNLDNQNQVQDELDKLHTLWNFFEKSAETVKDKSLFTVRQDLLFAQIYLNNRKKELQAIPQGLAEASEKWSDQETKLESQVMLIKAQPLYNVHKSKDRRFALPLQTTHNFLVDLRNIEFNSHQQPHSAALFSRQHKPAHNNNQNQPYQKGNRK